VQPDDSEDLSDGDSEGDDDGYAKFDVDMVPVFESEAPDQADEMDVEEVQMDVEDVPRPVVSLAHLGASS
jgi:hypothetical protein